jgi:hypothetical protein
MKDLWAFSFSLGIISKEQLHICCSVSVAESRRWGSGDDDGREWGAAGMDK